MECLVFVHLSWVFGKNKFKSVLLQNFRNYLILLLFQRTITIFSAQQ